MIDGKPKRRYVAPIPTPDSAPSTGSESPSDFEAEFRLAFGHARPLSTDSAPLVEEQFRLFIGHACARVPVNAFVVTQDDATEEARIRLLRLLRSNRISKALLNEIADHIEGMPGADFRGIFSAETQRPGPTPDKTKDFAAIAAYDLAFDETGDSTLALQRAYDGYYGEGRFVWDSRPASVPKDPPKANRGNNTPTTAEVNMRNTIRRVLQEAGLTLPKKAAGRPRKNSR